MDLQEDYFTTLYEELTKSISNIQRESFDDLTMARFCVESILKTTALLRQHVINIGFISDAEEIKFFKEVKPRFYCRLLFFSKVAEVELNRPTGSRRAEVEFLRKEESKLAYFFEKYRDFYQYYRSGSTYLDEKFFLRNRENHVYQTEMFGLDTDPQFTTLRDYIIAKINANELLKEYFEHEIMKLKQDYKLLSETTRSTNITWTAPKASLIELLYGLQSAGAFNNGSAGLQQVATCFEQCFNVKLGNHYRIFQEIRIRKKNRTQFMDEVKKRLVEKMDSTDNNLK